MVRASSNGSKRLLSFVDSANRLGSACPERAWERFAVERGGHRTLVRPFPVSVAFPEGRSESPSTHSVYLLRSELFSQIGVEAAFMGIGVDRVDYTKGIRERFRAVERFLENRPAYRGRFTFVQIGAPSRTHIKRYLDLLDEADAEAQRINARFQAGRWKPLVFLKRHHSHEEIEEYYKAADVCMVTSLHDGMNLVAKEFVAASGLALPRLCGRRSRYWPRRWAVFRGK